MLSGQSILERILEEIPDSPHPSPFDKKIVPFIDSHFDVGRLAVETLEEPDEIVAFMDAYVAYIREKAGLNKEQAQERAKSNVGYATGYVDDRKANLWFQVLPDISHPITGRERPFLSGEAGAYYIIVTNTTPEAVRYIQERLDDLRTPSLAPSFDITHITESGINPYTTFKLTTKSRGICAQPSDVYLFLSGFVSMLPRSMERDIGITTKISVEMPRPIQ